MRISLAIAIILAIGNSGCDRAPQPAAVDVVFAAPDEKTPTYRPLQIPIAAVSKPSPLGCTILAGGTLERGSAPLIRVSIVNETQRPIYLPGCLDGSEVRERFPHCYFEITGPKHGPEQIEDEFPDAAILSRVRFCNIKNPLRTKDFVSIPPGGRFDPYHAGDPRRFSWSVQLDRTEFRRPGEYRIRFVYSTSSVKLSDWLGSVHPASTASPRLVELFNQVPKMELRSNEIKVTILDHSR